MTKSQKSYAKLSEYYDAIYNNLVDYESQTSYLEKIFRKFHKGQVRSILDVGCGTGNFTFVFAKRDYHVTGIDISRCMIDIAKRKKILSSKKKPDFFRMDMRNIQLPEKYDVATVLFGGFGYLLNHDDVLKFFTGIKRNLNKCGLLIFEFWHVSGLRPESSSEQGFTSFQKVRHGNNLIIRLDRNKYNPATNICTLSFDAFVISPKTKALIDMFSETHRLRVYAIHEIRKLLEDNDFSVIGFFEDSLGRSPRIEDARQSSFRVLAVASA
jgi:SAM-dependent methyltransferase